MDERTDRAWNAGWTAHFAGKLPTDNPHKLATAEREALAWVRGYNRARTERRRANQAMAQGLTP